MNLNEQFKYKVLISYDGTGYCGWQIQPNSLSIQAIIQNALTIILREKILIIGSGRTDAGVHALGQVAHFSTNQPIDLSKTLLSLNGLLPKDIRIKSLYPVVYDFHARYSALGKIYRYHLDLSPFLNPFKRFYACHIPHPFDRRRLKDAAQFFIGTHDFTSFSNEAQRGSAAKNPVRTLKRLDILEEEFSIILEYEANGFLYKMVRNITGTLIDVAKGKLSFESIPRIFSSRDRRAAGSVAPAKALFLTQVLYPKKYEEILTEAVVQT